MDMVLSLLSFSANILLLQNIAVLLVASELYPNDFNYVALFCSSAFIHTRLSFFLVMYILFTERHHGAFPPHPENHFDSDHERCLGAMLQ